MPYVALPIGSLCRGLYSSEAPCASESNRSPGLNYVNVRHTCHARFSSIAKCWDSKSYLKTLGKIQRNGCRKAKVRTDAATL